MSLRFFRFVGAGGLGICLYYLILVGLTELAGLWYALSSVVAGLINIASNFVLHRWWTFGHKGTHNIIYHAGKYVALVAVLVLLNTALLVVLVEQVQMHYVAAQILLTAVLTLVSYAVSKRIFAGTRPDA